jgi:hypothetical protein
LLLAYLRWLPKLCIYMHAFAPRRSTEPQISLAITLGWRIATLYSLRADELPTAPPDNLLPMRRSLPATERLVLELRAALGDAARLGAALHDREARVLLDLAERAAESDAAEAAFGDRIRTWHIDLVTVLWADHEATGKAYELGSFLADTSNRVVLALRRGDDARAHVTRELRCVFASARIDRIKRLLDDLQARIDPAAVRIVKQHLARWQTAVEDRTLRSASRAGLEPLDSQAVIWCQLVTGDKEPEAFIGHDDRARVRDTMVGRMLRSYGRNWKAILGLAGASAAAVAVIRQVGFDPFEETPVVAFFGPLAGALGLSITSIGLTVRKSLDARAELLWNTALVDVISRKTLLVEEILAPAQPAHPRLTMPVRRRRSHGDGAVLRLGDAARDRRRRVAS